MPTWLNTISEEAHENLKSQPSADEGVCQMFLTGRGVSEADIVLHKIGYAGPGLLVKECAQDFIPWSQNFLHECLTFPMYNMLGEVIGLQIRTLHDTPDRRPYKQYYAYHRDIFPYFFGLPQTLPYVYASGYLIIVEGIFDYFAVRKVTPNVLAVLTSGVPVSCRRFFKRFTKRVVAMLDMDEPGREGALRLSRESEHEGYHVTIPTYSLKDPGELYLRGRLHEIERIVRDTSLGITSPHNTPV